MDENLTELSRGKLLDRMDALSKEIVTVNERMEDAEIEHEKKAAEVVYETLKSKYDQVKAEYDNRSDN